VLRVARSGWSGDGNSNGNFNGKVN